MRFAPPKSAPTETRRCTKYTEKEEDYNLSGWVIKPVQPDITLLRQCLTTAPRRCSSATERTSGGSLIVHFNRVTNSLRYKLTSSEGSIKSRTYSKDSGVGLTETGGDTMATENTPVQDNRGHHDNKLADDEEFSDISESNDGSTDNDAELVGLTASELEFSEVESRDTEFSEAESRDTSLSALGSSPLHHEEVVAQEVSHSEESGNMNTANSNKANVNLTATNVDKNSLLSRNKRRAKREVEREHQIPHPVTPEIPEFPVPCKQQQVWSRSRKLERHNTNSSDACSQVYELKKEPDQFLNNPFENVLHANRPPYRNEKRRASFKSSCSIPSFSTPTQALLLIGMQPSNKPSPHDSNKILRRPPNRKLLQKPPPLMNKARITGHVNRNSLLELPALSVNGAGDLVIRKKQIISG